MTKSLATLAIASILVGACAGPVRMIQSANGTQQIYAISRDEADRVLLGAMLATFPDNPVERAPVPEPAVRYHARITFALDSHVVIATAMPSSIRAGERDTAPGYIFEVSDFGSMPLTGTSRSERLFSEIRARLSTSVPATRP